MTGLSEIISSGSEDDWLSAIPRYVQVTVAALRDDCEQPEDIARIWLTSRGPRNVAGLGSRNQASFYESFSDEMEKLICGDEKYESDRRKIAKEFTGAHTYVVAAIAAAISPVIGAAAPLLAPAVAMILVAIARVGVQAWCESKKD